MRVFKKKFFKISSGFKKHLNNQEGRAFILTTNIFCGKKNQGQPKVKAYFFIYKIKQNPVLIFKPQGQNQQQQKLLTKCHGDMR